LAYLCTAPVSNGSSSLCLSKWWWQRWRW